MEDNALVQSLFFPWCIHFVEVDGILDPYIGFVFTYEEALKVVREYEIHTTSKYISVSGRFCGDFAEDLTELKNNHRIHFRDEEFLGHVVVPPRTPFMILGSKKLECQQGTRHVKKTSAVPSEGKEDNMEGEEKPQDHRKRRRKPCRSKKVGCPSYILIRDLLIFPELQIDDDSKWKRDRASKLLRLDLDQGMIPGERRYYIYLPKPESHEGHEIGPDSGSLQPMDPQIIEEIHRLVGEGVRKVDEMKRHLRTFVTRELFPGSFVPCETNRRFFPYAKDIKNHIDKALREVNEPETFKKQARLK